MPAGTEKTELWPRQEAACREEVPDFPAKTENAQAHIEEATCTANIQDLPAGTEDAKAQLRQ